MKGEVTTKLHDALKPMVNTPDSRWLKLLFLRYQKFVENLF